MSPLASANGRRRASTGTHTAVSGRPPLAGARLMANDPCCRWCDEGTHTSGHEGRGYRRLSQRAAPRKQGTHTAVSGRPPLAGARLMANDPCCR
ncbi:MAG: hypothetical protein M0R74_13850 [Dehalococcoidia bacterium]|nr:hypothetical protein [Dehalococcoidia bacterium]